MKKIRNLAIILAATLLLVNTNGVSSVMAEETKQNNYNLNNPQIESENFTTWDCITFGNYFQSNSTTKEPIK